MFEIFSSPLLILIKVLLRLASAIGFPWESSPKSPIVVGGYKLFTFIISLVIPLAWVWESIEN
jgi:NADH:ubiquinone oxidoreductase subunit 3 (subunit A)